MEHPRREIFRAVSGNVVGIVTEPASPCLGDQQLVNIGVVSVERAKREPFPDTDLKRVAEELVRFLTGGTVTAVTIASRGMSRR